MTMPTVVLNDGPAGFEAGDAERPFAGTVEAGMVAPAEEFAAAAAAFKAGDGERPFAGTVEAGMVAPAEDPAAKDPASLAGIADAVVDDPGTEIAPRVELRERICRDLEDRFPEGDRSRVSEAAEDGREAVMTPCVLDLARVGLERVVVERVERDPEGDLGRMAAAQAMWAAADADADLTLELILKTFELRL
jgi:hypothetical protein